MLADKYEAEVEMKNTMLTKHYFHSNHRILHRRELLLNKVQR